MNNLDAFVGLLLFLAGAPALVIQLISNDVRHILLKSRRQQLAFIIKLYWPSLAGFFLIILGYSIYIDVAINNPNDARLYVVEAILLSIMILLTLIVCIMILPYASKRGLVTDQARRVINRHKSQRHMPAIYINNLVLLGRESKPGEEKSWSIEAIGKIVTYRLSDAVYRGNEMESLINALHDILLGDDNCGAPENFQKAIDILSQIIQQYHHQSNISQADLRWSQKALSSLGKRALDFHTPDVALSCINALGVNFIELTPSASQSLCEIAETALNKKQTLVAMQALNIIGSAVYEAGLQPQSAEIMYDYLGLLGAFWAHGESAQSIANRDLNDLKAGGKINLKELVERAIEHHRETLRFEVADKISTMWSEY